MMATSYEIRGEMEYPDKRGMGVAKSLRVLKEPFSPVARFLLNTKYVSFFRTNALFRQIAFRLILRPIRPALSHMRARSPTL